MKAHKKPALWRLEQYDSAWGGWRTVDGGTGFTKSAAEDHARRLTAQSTFKYRARPEAEVAGGE